MAAEDVVGTLAGEYIDAKYVLHYLRAVDKALATGTAHCSYRINDVRLFALMTRLSSMRIRVEEWIILRRKDLEVVIDIVVGRT